MAKYDIEQDPEYLAWCDEQVAIQEGKAMALKHCYECWFRDNNKGMADAQSGPLRGVLRERTVNPVDPTTAYVLTPCGHTIIDL